MSLSIALLALTLLGAQDERWLALPVPELSLEPVAPPPVPALEPGSHLALGDTYADPLAERELSVAPHLPVGVFLELIDEDARRRGERLEIRRPPPPILLRGPASALARSRALVADLDAAARAMEIDVAVWLFDGAANGAADGAADGAAPQGPPDWTGRTRSGGSLTFGERRSASFLSGYRVDVANGAGAADPELATALTGELVALRAWRVGGGERVLVSGVLDLAELAGLESFDPDSPDLGTVQVPTIGALEVRFAGTFASGEPLRVRVEGAPLERPARTLWVRATTRPDERSPDRAWRCADVALVGSAVSELALPSPGSGLAVRTSTRAGTVVEPLTAASIWGQVEAAFRERSFGADAPGPPFLVYAPGLLIAPADDAALWSEVDALVAAAESARTRTALVTVAHGDLRVELPVAEGYPARVLAGTETTALVDYDTEIAQDSWMGLPRIAKAFDGVCVQGRLARDAFVARHWVARSEPGGSLGRADTTHGGLALPRRTSSEGIASARIGTAGYRAERADRPGLSIAVRER